MLVTMPAGVVALPVWLQANAGSGFLMYASRSARATDMKAVKPTKTGSVTSAIRGTRDLRCCAITTGTPVIETTKTVPDVITSSQRAATLKNRSHHESTYYREGTWSFVPGRSARLSWRRRAFEHAAGGVQACGVAGVDETFRGAKHFKLPGLGFDQGGQHGAEPRVERAGPPQRREVLLGTGDQGPDVLLVGGAPPGRPDPCAGSMCSAGCW